MKKWNNPLQRSKRENAKLQKTARDIFSPEIGGIFNEVRPYIDCIDSLRYDGIDEDLPVPAIAVIGDQSSGKSSVLEALSGVALPRGSGIVTRCPLELKLRRQKGDLPLHAMISYRDKATEFTDPTLVEGYVNNAQNELAGEGVGICNELISLEITSPDVCDLTLIDLPGIVRVPVKGQPEDIGDQVKRLINRFIQQTETIILVVVPCNVDIATTEALKMAQEVDPNHKRTLAILTKPDLVDRGTEKNILKIVDNKVIQLSKGYIVVKCRGQQQIQDRIPLAEATKMEVGQHQYFSRLYDEEKATISCLAAKLTRELVEHIKNILPTLSEQINHELMESKKLLSLCPPTDLIERKIFLSKIINQFNDIIKRLSDGEIVDDVNPCRLLRKHFIDWRENLEGSKTSYSKEVEKMLTEYDKKHRGRELRGVIDFKVFEKVVRDKVMEQHKPALTTLREIRKTIDELFNGVLNNCFTNCPFLLKIAKNKIGNIQSKQQAKVEERIREQFLLEQLVYTDDRNLSAYVEAATTGENGENSPNKNILSWWNRLVLQDKKSTGSLTKMADHSMKLLLEAYYEIVIQRLADQIPMLIQHFLVKESTELLINEMQGLIEVMDLEKAFSEGPDAGQCRSKLERRIKRLGQAQEDLSRLLY